MDFLIDFGLCGSSSVSADACLIAEVRSQPASPQGFRYVGEGGLRIGLSIPGLAPAALAHAGIGAGYAWQSVRIEAGLNALAGVSRLCGVAFCQSALTLRPELRLGLVVHGIGPWGTDLRFWGAGNWTTAPWLGINGPQVYAGIGVEK
jgi:hypothetical protein